MRRRQALGKLLGGAALLGGGLSLDGCGGQPAGTGQLLGTWGKWGMLPGRFIKPRAIAFDRQDRAYLVDMRAIIQVFTSAGEPITSWQTPTHEWGRPSGLCIDNDGHVLVADSHYHRILKYSATGELLDAVGGDEGDTLTAGKLAGRFGYLGDIAVDKNGRWYVAESQQRELITCVGPTGAVEATWGGRGELPGQFQRIRALSFADDGLLYVADSCNHRIQVFQDDGTLVRVFGKPGKAAGALDYPFDLAHAPDGTLVVCEYGNHRVQRFSRDGQSLGVWGTPGRGAGELWNPWAVGIDSAGVVYVVDSNNHRVHRVRL